MPNEEKKNNASFLVGDVRKVARYKANTKTKLIIIASHYIYLLATNTNGHYTCRQSH